MTPQALFLALILLPLVWGLTLSAVLSIEAIARLGGGRQ